MRSTQQLLADGWRALTKELGLADALRYRVLFQPGTGDYAREREALLADKSLAEIGEELAEWQAKHGARRKRKRR